MKLAFLQYGDFANDHQRLTSGGAETYRDQRASVEYIADLADRFDVSVVSIGKTSEALLKDNLRSVGITNAEAYNGRAVELLSNIRPDMLICRTPHLEALKWAARTGTSTLPNFADIFRGGGLKGWAKNWRFRRLMSAPVFPCVSNHSLNASRSLVDVGGLPADKVIPWDWSRLSIRKTARPAAADPFAPTFFFAGGLEESKGVGDCLDAIAKLHGSGSSATMAFAGPGDLDIWRARAEALGLGQAITFLGRLPHDDVRQRMEAADGVIVPSRHSYGEGLPNTIYEALAACTPLIISDHPAFEGRLQPEETCLMFRAGDSDDLAAAMRRIANDPVLAARLTASAPVAHDSLYIGMEWTALMDAYLSDPQNQTGWVQQNSMTALGL